MNLLDLMVRIGVDDDASGQVNDISQNIVSKLGGAAVKAAKALAGMWAVKQVVNFGKAAFEAYESFEQLEGGAKLAFGDAYDFIEKRSQEAFKNVQMSQNDYLTQVNGLAVGLRESMGGNSQAAAELADKVVTAQADIVSAMGITQESAQNAFNGIMKGNFTMLDNLQLGIKPTKEGMQEVIDKVNDWRRAQGEAGDLTIDSLADCQAAVVDYVDMMGYAGYAAKEGMSTLEGSASAARAAWQNLVTEFGKPDANIGPRIRDLFDSVFGMVDKETGKRKGGLFNNVKDEVSTIASNMVSVAADGIRHGIGYVFDNGPELVATAMSEIGDAIERGWTKILDFRSDFNLVDAMFGSDGQSGIVGKVGDWLGRMGKAISEEWPYVSGQLGLLWDELVATAETFGPQILEVAKRLLGMAADAIREHGPEILTSGKELVGKIGTAIVEKGPEALSKLGEMLGRLIGHVGKFVSKMAKKGMEFVGGLITGSSKSGKKLHKWFADFFPDGLLKGLGDFATFLIEAGKSLIDGLLNGIGEVAPNVEQAIRDAFQKVLDFFGGVANFIADPIGSIKSGLSALGDSFWGTEGEIESSTSAAGGAIDDLNNIKLKDKKVKATVSGNAKDVSTRKSVDDTRASIEKLKGKTVTASVGGNIVSGAAKFAIDSVRDAISKLKDKSVTTTVNKKTVVTKEERATGGIRKHARGDIMVANNPGPGVPLDIVGEAGPEAIVPLTSRYGKTFAQMMGQEAARYMGGPTYILQIGDVQYNTDKAMDEAIDNWFKVAARRAGQYGIG